MNREEKLLQALERAKNAIVDALDLAYGEETDEVAHDLRKALRNVADARQVLEP